MGDKLSDGGIGVSIVGVVVCVDDEYAFVVDDGVGDHGYNCSFDIWEISSWWCVWRVEDK